MRLKSEPAYSCSHPQLTPWGQAHWAGWGCCQSAGGERHCQVSLTLLAPAPISPCHCQEAGSASSQCQRPTGCSLPTSPNSLRQCQHQLALGEASLSEPSAHCQLCFDFHVACFDTQGLTAAPSASCGSWCMFTTCCIWPKSKWCCPWDTPPSCTCPCCLPPCWLWPCPWSPPWPPWPWLWLRPWPTPRGWKPWLSPWWPWPWWCPWWWPCPVASSTGGIVSPLGCASAFSLHSSGVSVLCGKNEINGHRDKRDFSVWAYLWHKCVSNISSEDFCLFKLMCFLAVMCGLYLMCALATHPFAVGVFDCTLHMAYSDDGVRKWNVVGETATPDQKWIEKNCY